jgi:hypothetical protein
MESKTKRKKKFMMTLIKILNELPIVHETIVPHTTEEQLNCTDEGSPRDYDRSLRFRQLVIAEGFRIQKLIAVYYQGWEMDQWAAFATKDGKHYKVGTNHGSLEVREV